jgi:hypothetical protein
VSEIVTYVEVSIFIPHSVPHHHPHHAHVLLPLFEKIVLFILIFFPQLIFMPSVTRLPEYVDQPFCEMLSIMTLLYPLMPNVISSHVLLEIFIVPEPIKAVHQDKLIVHVVI